MPEHISMDKIAPLLEQHTAIVLPVYFRPNSDVHTGASLLRDTVYLLTREVQDPTAICLSVDGPGPGIEISQQIANEFANSVVCGERNQGKFAAVQRGMVHLLERTHLRYFAALDSDGDHFANELLNFIRAAEHCKRATGQDRILIQGDRVSRHRPLGFARGELEELADRVLLDALAYHAAQTGVPLDLRFTDTGDSVPDFHSGYKVYTRQTAEDIFLSSPNFADCSPRTYYQHACEAVPVVEAITRGALLVSVNRRTFDEQPVSTFAALNRIQLHADLIIWPCKRLNIPLHFVRQWLDNHLPPLLMGTLVPQGRDELLAIRARVLEAFGDKEHDIAITDITRPEFI